MLSPITPARRLARAIETRGIEAQLIRRLVDLADAMVGEAGVDDHARWHQQREELSAVLHGASAMIGDLVEELGRLEDRALALQDAPSTVSAAHAPNAA